MCILCINNQNIKVYTLIKTSGILHGKNPVVPLYAKIQSTIWGSIISKRTHAKMTAADGKER